MAIARGLRKAMIEAAAAATRYMRHHAVENLASLLVLIEAVVQEGAQEAPALRHAESIGALEVAALIAQHGDVVAAVFQERDHVAHRRGAESDYSRIFGRVHQLVDATRLEAFGH